MKCNVFRWVVSADQSGTSFLVQTKVEQDLDLFFGATLVITIKFLVLDHMTLSIDQY